MSLGSVPPPTIPARYDCHSRRAVSADLTSLLPVSVLPCERENADRLLGARSVTVTTEGLSEKGCYERERRSGQAQGEKRPWTLCRSFRNAHNPKLLSEWEWPTHQRPPGSSSSNIYLCNATCIFSTSLVSWTSVIFTGFSGIHTMTLMRDPVKFEGEKKSQWSNGLTCYAKPSLATFFQLSHDWRSRNQRRNRILKELLHCRFTRSFYILCHIY